ncbi:MULTISPECIES: cell division protein FtsQ/DivIB [unclassified Pseudoalteromonas]|uniref:cell division protein FtsQ/DivIB n=1 Tax=unclassified Pseudoalteromonas TaxID=194690 RepID=UPI00209689B1|nr:cell division protein FtsQ/DivIB [Pseudoalteromonas sp. XMcav2-N]MCO7188708.1 cell division protein FtsQ/DivIB [Pseudoalteromonas sp. XMcav2-N]
MRALFGKIAALKHSVNWSLFFGVGFFLIVLLGLMQTGLWARDWLTQHRDTQIKTLTVLGQPYYTAENDIVAAIRKADLSSFFELDVKAVHDQVQALPWVATVSVRKQWPDALQVYVVEHKPVAYWNSDLLLNSAGGVFQANSTRLSKTLPELYGPEGSEVEAWQTFVQLKEMLAVNQFNLVSLALSERFAWQLWLDNGIRLNLGREDKAQRVQRFIDVYPRLEKPEGAQVDAIDLRYDTGLAVSWKFSQNEDNKDKSKA